MMSEHERLLLSESARCEFFSRLEARASRRSFLRTFAAVVLVGFAVAAVLPPLSRATLAWGGPYFTLLAWLALGIVVVWALQRLIPCLGAEWERALHDSISARLRLMRLREQDDDWW